MGDFKTTLGAGVAAAAVSAVLAATPASANTVLGSVWAVTTAIAGSATPANVPSRPADLTFSAPSTPLDFNSNGASGVSTFYTPASFIGSGSGTVLTDPGGIANTSLDNDLFQIQGNVTVTSGQPFTVAHDDGLTLIIGGSTVISAPGATVAVLTPGTYDGPSGTFAFDLVYGECCGAPAVLDITLPLVTPSPDPDRDPGTGVASATRHWACRPWRRDPAPAQGRLTDAVGVLHTAGRRPRGAVSHLAAFAC